MNEAHIPEKKSQKLENAPCQELFQQRKRKDNPVDPAKTYISKRITNGQEGFKQKPITRSAQKIHIQGAHAYQARLRRKAKQQNKQFEIIDDNNEDLDTEITVHKKLKSTDLEILRSKSLWLNDRLVDACMGLLKSAYPQVQGMQDWIMSDTLKFQSVKGNFVQILNCAKNHWICLSTFGCPPGKINVFDSNCTGDIPLTTKEAIATLLNTPEKLIYFVVPVTMQ